MKIVRLAVGSAALSTLLFGMQADQTYVNGLKTFLKGKSFSISGKFYMYDFEHDGTIDANDWLFLTPDNQAFRLMGKTPTAQDAFGWQPLQNVPDTLNLDNPSGYFIFLNMPLDQERYHTNAFSWVYVLNGSDTGYKLMGAKADHTFDYLDLTGDNVADPIPGISFKFNGDQIVTTLTTQQPSTTAAARTLLFYGETNHKTLAGWKNLRVFDPANPTKILYKNDDTTDCRRPAVTTAFDSFDPQTLQYSGLHMQTLHFVAQKKAYRLSLTNKTNVHANQQGNFDLSLRSSARYSDFNYLGTKQYLIASDTHKKSYLFTPDGNVFPFDNKSLLDLSYSSYGAPINGYILYDKSLKEIQYCTTDMQTCSKIISYKKSIKNIGSIGGTTQSIYLIDNETYLYDKATKQLQKLDVTLPPRVGHTTPYALNGNSLYYVQDEDLYRYNIATKELKKIATGTKTARLRAFTDKMVIMADDDYIYAAAKDGSTPQAILLSQTTQTRGHKYNTSLGTGKYYLFNTWSVNIQDGSMHFRACAMRDQNDIQCKENSFWASTIVANPNGKLNFQASYIYTPQYFIRIDDTDNYGGGKVTAVSADNPLGDGVVLGSIDTYNFQTFINSGYKDEMVNNGGYIFLNAKNDLSYQSNTFLLNLNEPNSIRNISNEPTPPDSEINGGRSHCHGRYCVICHSFAGGKIYASWDPKTKKYKDLTPETVGKYTIQFKFNNGQTLRAAIKKGMGENFNTPLQNLTGKKFTAQVVKIDDGTVVNSSDEYSHNGVEYFNCNYCHYRYGPRNDAPGVITVTPIP